jgi:predicted membrane protein
MRIRSWTDHLSCNVVHFYSLFFFAIFASMTSWRDFNLLTAVAIALSTFSMILWIHSKRMKNHCNLIQAHKQASDDTRYEWRASNCHLEQKFASRLFTETMKTLNNYSFDEECMNNMLGQDPKTDNTKLADIFALDRKKISNYYLSIFM